MNKQDTTENRLWIESVISLVVPTSTITAMDEIRAAVIKAIDERYPPSDRNMLITDGLVELFDTMLNEEFERAMREQAARDEADRYNWI